MKKNYKRLFVALLFATNLMAQNVPNYVPRNGLVGWWPFNGNANDESGNGNNGTVNGATLTSDRNGKMNSAYSFNGINNYIRIPNATSLNFDNKTSFTISAWINLTGSNLNYSGIVEKMNVLSDNSGTGYQFLLYQNKLYSEFGQGAEIQSGLSGTINLNDNQWHQVIWMVNRTNNTHVFYLDNNYHGTITNNNISLSNIDNLSDLLIGVERGLNYYFNGKIDDIGIWNQVLNQQEIKQLYEGCTKETAISSSFNSYVFTNNTPVNLAATPAEGTFSGDGVANNNFNPSKAKLGKNQVKYNFKNSTGCADSTNFTMILVDTLGNKCTETIYDTIKVKESTYDTLKIKVQLTTGIKAGQLTSMNVYPNPASDVLIIEANDIQALGGYKYKIVDLQGKEVYNALATSAKTEISLKSIGAKGMYILHFVDEKGVSIENKKIVLE